jgi:hypothetical protein
VSRWRRRIATALTLLFLLLLALLTNRVWAYRESERETRRSVMERAREETRRAAEAVDDSLRRVVPVVHEVSRRLGSGEAERDGVEALLVEATEELPELIGIGALYRPGAQPAAGRLHSPYRVLADRGSHGGARRFELVSAHERVDYTRFGVRRYTDTLLDGPTWVAPDLSGLARQPTASYSEPFYPPGSSAPDAEPAGVVSADVSLAWVGQRVDEFGLGRFGYGFLLAQDGSFVSHPRHALVDEGQTIFELAWATGDPALHAVGIRAIQRESTFLERYDPATGRLSWVFVEPVPVAGWSLVTVFIEDELRRAPEAERRALIAIALLALGCGLAGFAAFAFRFSSGSVAALWASSSVVAGLLLVATLIIWILAFRNSEALTPEGVQIIDRVSMELFLEASRTRERGALLVPTGIFLSSLEMPEANLVRVRGYIWQRYGPELPASATRGFVLPHADSVTKDVAYRTVTKAGELIGWEFSADLRQRFDFRKYPFDRQKIRIEVQPAEFGRQVVLVPDLEAYGLTNPKARPGLDEEIDVPGWRILESYFDFHQRAYNTTFGVVDVAHDERLELEFGVELQREFLSPFVSDLIPVLVAIGMLFGMLISGTQREDRVKSSGFSSLRLLGASSALFFVVVFQHIALRRELASPELVYVEYFHFSTYAMMLLVSVNAILFAMGGRTKLVDYEDNLVPKLLFWPVFLTVAFSVTLRTFY